jgi:hypothetical protein
MFSYHLNFIVETFKGDKVIKVKGFNSKNVSYADAIEVSLCSWM